MMFLLRFVWCLILISILGLPTESMAQKKGRLFKGETFDTEVRYFPFYYGVQMIEIDRLTPFYQEVSFMEQTQPRALPWEMVLGPPPTNSYLFRNEQGQIVLSFGDTDDVLILKTEACKPLISPHNHWKNRVNKVMFGGVRLDLFPYYPIGEALSGSLGLIDSLGNVVLPQKFNAIYGEKESFISVEKQRYVLMNKALETVFTCEDCRLAFYDNYEDGVMIIRDDLRGLLDFSGKEVISCNYSMILPRFHYEGLLEVRSKGRIGIVNWNDQVVLPLDYQSLGEFSFGLLNCRKNDLWGYVNAKGETIIPHQFSIALNFIEGFAKVAIKKEGNYYFGFINTKGETVVPLEYEKAEHLENGKVRVKRFGEKRWTEILLK